MLLLALSRSASFLHRLVVKTVCEVSEMCGIIGYTGSHAALSVLMGGLSALEYRGYDSAGVALCGEELRVIKRKGRLSALAAALAEMPDTERFCCGIGHTRWATHGEPADRNAHPHGNDRLALVHNGIIENDAEIITLLKGEGYVFSSETDTEAAALLIDWLYRQCKDPQAAIFKAVAMLRGSYAFGVVFADLPDRIYAIRRDNPLIVATGPTGNLIASDVPAILSHTRRYYRPDDGVLAVLTPKEIRFFNAQGNAVTPEAEQVDFDLTAAQKGGHPHFMRKEIFEEPQALQRTVSRYLGADGLPCFPGLDERFAQAKRVHILGCGTAMHAGLVGARVMEKLARVPAFVEIASEFRYREPLLDEDDLVILLSQSGETADTLAALRYAKARGILTLAVVNVVGSSVAREADAVLYTPAGPEIAVASTKAYSVQCAVLYLLALRFALCRGRIAQGEASALCSILRNELPGGISAVLAQSDRIVAVAERVLDAQHLFYIGRGMDVALCTEGSLKLKEISYIHSEAYAAGELKHGTISLVEQGTPILAVLTEQALAEKMISAIREVRARGATVIAVCCREIAEQCAIPCDEQILLPAFDERLSFFLAATALQLFAYHTAAAKGLDVDKPRNLAKSVTVE